MNKAKVIDQKAENNVMKERLYLSNMRSPFIVNIVCSFQDLNNLYLGLELLKALIMMALALVQILLKVKNIKKCYLNYMNMYRKILLLECY